MTVAVAPPDPQPAHRVARAGLIFLVASVAIQGLNVVSGVVLARALGPAGRGELAAVLLWPSVLASVGDLSASAAVAYFTASGASAIRAMSATAFVVSVVQALALVVIGYVMMPLLLGHYGAHAVFAGRLYLGAWLPLNLAAAAGMAILQGRLEWAALNLARLVVAAAIVAGLMILVYAHHVSVLGATWVYIAATSLGFAIIIAVLVARRWVGLHPDMRLTRSIMTFGLKTHGGSLAGQANLNMDKMAVATFLPQSDLGLYSVAVTLSAPLTLIGSSIGIVALPAVAASASASEMRHQLAWFCRSALLLSTVTTLALVVLTPVLIRAFFGAAFAPATVIAQLCIIAAMARALGSVLAHGLSAFNKPLVPSAAEGIAVLVTIAGLAVLLPRMGLVGAAITSLMAYGASTACMVWFLTCRLEIALPELIWPRRTDIGPWARCLRR